jgi:hypothetical protein
LVVYDPSSPDPQSALGAETFAYADDAEADEHLQKTTLCNYHGEADSVQSVSH